MRGTFQSLVNTAKIVGEGAIYGVVFAAYELNAEHGYRYSSYIEEIREVLRMKTSPRIQIGNYYTAGSVLQDYSQQEANAAKSVQRGQQKQYLFTGSKPTEENGEVRDMEKHRFMRYLSDHKLGSRRLTCQTGDTLNDVVTCFAIEWQARGLTAEPPSGRAIFRFLTEECGLQSEVTELSYANKIKHRLRSKEYTVETQKEVNLYF